VWLEVNTRYTSNSLNGMSLAPAILKTIFDAFEWLSYGKSWRLWYAYGAERPKCDIPWGCFSWDTDN
jgi:hypothetical protein